jgi:tubulin-specific chaperone A
MSQADVVKALKVKTGALKRLHKELLMYEKERDREQAKVDKLRSEGADAHDLKQAVRAKHCSLCQLSCAA